MTKRIIAFDVETPNAENARMSAIGLAVIENGKIAHRYYTLVNPEARFDAFNIELTGITPEEAAHAPTFPEVWRKIKPMLWEGLLIAHNAPFDMAVLGKCLNAYRISWKPSVNYACTCQIGRKLLPALENHRLNTLCDYFGIELDHHKADSDSFACASLMLHYMSDYAARFNLNSFIRTYDLKNLHTEYRR